MEDPLLASALDGIRLSLHVIAATIWVGGQLVVAGLVPSLRKSGGDATKVVARAFARIAWPAYAVLILTGLWNYSSFNMNKVTTAWKIVISIKIAVALFSGLAVYLHQRAKSPKQTGVWGGIAALSSVAALVMGVFVAG